MENLHFFLLLKIANRIRDNNGLEEVDVVGVEVIKVTDAGGRDPILQFKSLKCVVRLDEVDDLLGGLFARRARWKLHGLLSIYLDFIVLFEPSVVVLFIHRVLLNEPLLL